MARVTFRKGIEANLPTQGLAEEGCVYLATDTGNVYVGDSNGSLVPLNRSPYYGTCSSVGSTNSKVVTLDVEDDNFSLYAGAMISVRFDNANIASSPTLNVNGTGAVAVKDYGTTNIDTSSESWSGGEVVTFVYDGSYWQRVGSKKKVSELHSRGFVGETGSADSIATTTGVLTFKNIARVAANSFPGTSNANAILDINTYSNNSYNHQIGFSSNGKLYHRSRGGSWAAWKELYHLGDDISTEYLKEPNHSIYTATTLPLISTTRANRLALLPSDQIIVEQTTDGGTTWVDAGVTDAQKNSLFHGGTRTANIKIPLLDGVRSKLCGIRITITGMKYDVPSGTTETEKYNYWNKDYPLSSERYVSICGMYFWIFAISDSIRVRVYRATGAAPNSWISASNEDAYLSGSAGGGYISIPSNADFGGGITQTANSWNYRIVFFTDGNNGGDLSSTNPTSAQYIYRIFGYGSNCCNFSNRLMVNDHLYDWGFDQTMITPSTVRPPENVSTADLGATDGRWRKIYGVDEDLSGDIRANKLIKVGGTSAQFLKADGSVDSNTYLTESSGSGTFVKVKPVRGFYNNNDSWNAYFADSSFDALKYIRITLPDTSVNVWAFLYFEFSIMQNYNANRYGKLLLFGRHSSSATATWSLNGALSGTLERIFVYGSDKKYIYIRGVARYGSISINKIMSGDSVSLIDISDISIDVVDSLPETYQTATITAASGFDNITVGSSSKPIYLNNGTPTEISRFPEALLMWGGMNYSGGYGPVDAAMVSELGACRTMFSKAAGIVVEYSTDGGATWLDYGATDAEKIGLFSSGQTFYTGKNSTNGGGSVNNMLRVTIRTSDASIYTTLNKFVIFVGTYGSSGCYCTIRIRTQQNYEDNIDTWETIADQEPISGWNGYNVINTVNRTTYGNTKSSQYGEWQFIFGCTGFSGNYTGLAIYKIFGFGGVGWVTPSNMAKNGHLYGYDSLQNATFPANITAEKFIKTGGTSSQFLMADGSVVAANSIALDTNVVHKTGNETIAGVKTFADNVVVGESKQVVLNTGQDGYVYLDAWADNSGKTLSVLDENDFDVRLQGVDTPIANNDAANKAYVDSVASGGASLNVGNSKVFFGTSTTGASTTTKDVTCADFTSSDLVEGVMVLVKFSTKNTGAVASLKLNVNGTGAYNIKKIYYTSGVTNLTNAAEIAANSVIPFIFTGSYWLVAGLDYNTDTTYSAMTSAAISAGTETTGRLVTAKLLKDNLVYKTGNENVAGVKTFTDGVLVKDSDFGIVSENQSKHSVYLSVDNYYDDGSEGIGVLSLDDPSGYGDVIVRCVANPIQSTDAANKAYVDSVIGGSRSILDGCSGVHGLKKYSICAIDAVDEEMYPFINQSTNVVESGVSFRIGTNIYYYEGDDMGSEDDFTGVPFYTSNSNVPLSRNMIGSFGSADLPAHAHYYMKVTVNSSNGTWSPSAGSSGTLIVHQNLLEQGCFYIHLGYENGEQDSFTLEEENPLYYFNGTNLVPYESYETSNCVHKTGTETIGGAKTFSTSCTVPNPTNLYHAATKKYVDDIVGDIETLLAAI